jgi:hypothetical protein
VTGEPITRTRIPYNLPTSNSAASPQASSSLVQTVVEILTGPLSYVELWVGLFIVSWVGSNLIRRWVFERRDRQWLYSLVRLPVNVTRYVFVGALLAFGGALMIGQVLLLGFLGYAWGGPVGAILGSAFGLWLVYLQVTEKQGDQSAQSN